MKDRPAGYSGLQKLIHWVTALLVLTLIPVGFIMVARGQATNFDAVTGQLYTAHKSFGALVLLLVLARIAVRLGHGTPAPEPTLSRPQIIAAEAVHGLIYLALLAVPLLGWAGSSAYGARGLLFGLTLPEILGKNPDLAKKILQLHGLAALALAGLVAAHIGAALMHRFVLKDGVLRRMLP